MAEPPVETGGNGEPDDRFVSLYRRFRPGKFSELRGQPHVVMALRGAVGEGRVAHAYLFSGPRGTGKTTAARLLARALNCENPQDSEPCGTCRSCVEIAQGTSFDVFELDAASNNGVDAMRDLVAHAALGTPGRWKVYIVDEVHMLSNAASNALLKTLEEPPSHVVFVLATTDPQKVLPTIRSRTQHFEFRLLGADTLTELLREVRGRASLDLDDQALAVAVRRGRGSARDALSALDQVAATGSADELRPELDGLLGAVATDDAHGALVEATRLHEAGWGPQQLAVELVEELRRRFLLAVAPELAGVGADERDRLRDEVQRLGLPRVVRGMELLGAAQVEMRDAPDPRVVLEVAVVRLARPELDDSPAALAERLSRLERALSAGAPAVPEAGGPGPQGSSAAGVAPLPREVSPERAAARAAARSATSGPSSAAVADAPSGQERVPGRGQGAAGPAGEAAAETAPAPLASRPALGAYLRPRSDAAGPEVAGGNGQGASAASVETADPGAPASDDPGAAARSPVPAATSGQTGAGTPPDRDQLVEAWGDHVLGRLPARAKALYAGGRFVSVTGETAEFALPNDAHRERCREVQDVVERVLRDHFGTPVRLSLVVEPGAAGGAGAGSLPGLVEAPSASPDPTPSGPPADGEVIDPDDLYFDPDDPGEPADESAVQARLLQAFPGAEEVEA